MPEGGGHGRAKGDAADADQGLAANFPAENAVTLSVQAPASTHNKATECPIVYVIFFTNAASWSRRCFGYYLCALPANDWPTD